MVFFLVIIQLLAAYLCVHTYIAFNEIYSKGFSFFAAFFILLLGESFLFIMISEIAFGFKAYRWMMLSAYIAMVICFYLIFLYGISDILRIIKIYPTFLKYRFTEFLFFVVISCLITGYGYFNALNTKFKEINISTEKPNVNFNVIFISDLHIGTFGITKDRFAKVVDEINEKKPDLIIVGGDIVDRFVGSIYAENFDKPLKKLKAKYGVYAVLGNHEYYRNPIDSVEDIYEKLGMNVLRDESIRIPPLNIEIIGLDDKTKPYFGLGKLKKIKEFIKNEDFKLLVSHNPDRQKEAVENKIDLFLAGHTHAGQLFPMQIILNAMYDTVWGYDKFDNTQVYVSSGLGSWGPPVRVGNDSEVIFIKVKSK